MTDSAPSIDANDVLAPPDRLSELFHRVNKLLPSDPDVIWIPPEMIAGQALALMPKHGYSQLPVKEGNVVLGLFTYQGFALEVAEMAGKKVDATALPVEEFRGRIGNMNG